MSARKKPAACPVCQQPAVARYKPFCSRRCADVDLGRWLKGRYVIPGERVDPHRAAPPESDED